jgi:hypothetical protein
MPPISVPARLRQHGTGRKHTRSIYRAQFDRFREIRVCTTRIADGREAAIEKVPRHIIGYSADDRAVRVRLVVWNM